MFLEYMSKFQAHDCSDILIYCRDFYIRCWFFYKVLLWEGSEMADR